MFNKEGGVRAVGEDLWNEKMISEQSGKTKKDRLHEHELEELREHIDLISFNIGKVYQHAKYRSRKGYNRSKNSVKKKFHHLYTIEKSGLKDDGENTRSH